MIDLPPNPNQSSLGALVIGLYAVQLSKPREALHPWFSTLAGNHLEKLKNDCCLSPTPRHCYNRCGCILGTGIFSKLPADSNVQYGLRAAAPVACALCPHHFSCHLPSQAKPWLVHPPFPEVRRLGRFGPAESTHMGGTWAECGLHPPNSHRGLGLWGFLQGHTTGLERQVETQDHRLVGGWALAASEGRKSLWFRCI